MRSDLPLYQWAWPTLSTSSPVGGDAVDVPRAALAPSPANPDFWDLELRGEEGAEDRVVGDRIVSKNNQAKSGWHIEISRLKAIQPDGLECVWENGQPRLREPGKKLSHSEKHEWDLLVALRKGAQPWSWNDSGASVLGGRSLDALFWALARGYQTFARALLALPEAPTVEELAKERRYHTTTVGEEVAPIELNNDGLSLLDVFVSADRGDAVDFLLQAGWCPQQPQEWVKTLNHAQSKYVFQSLTLHGLPDIAWVHYWGLESRLVPVRIGEGLRTAEAVAIWRGCAGDTADEPSFRALLLQGMGLGRFGNSRHTVFPLRMSPFELWGSDDVLAQPIVSENGHASSLGRWLAVVAFWSAISTEGASFTVGKIPFVNPVFFASAGWTGAMLWLKRFEPMAHAELERAFAAVQKGEGERTLDDIEHAARLCYEGVSSFGVISGSFAPPFAVETIAQSLWKGLRLVKDIPSFEAMYCLNQVAGFDAHCAANTWVDSSRPADAEHLKKLCNGVCVSLLELLDEKKNVPPFEVASWGQENFYKLVPSTSAEHATSAWKRWSGKHGLADASQLMDFWMGILERPDFNELPLSPEALTVWQEAWREIPPAIMSSEFARVAVAKLREPSLNKSLPCPSPGRAKPRF